MNYSFLDLTEFIGRATSARRVHTAQLWLNDHRAEDEEYDELCYLLAEQAEEKIR